MRNAPLAETSISCPATGLPSRSSVTRSTRPLSAGELKSGMRMPSTTAAGHSGTVPRMVCSSPLGSLKLISA